MRIHDHSLLLVLSLAVLVAAACSGNHGGGAGGGGHDAWQLSLSRDGTEHELPTEIMNVYLMEDESELFEINGPNLKLVGVLPVSIGYDEELENVIGKTIQIHPDGGDPREPGTSFIQLPGESRWRVLGGTFVPDRKSGSLFGVEGDLTISGFITLQVETGLGVETLTGRLGTHVVSWG